METSPTGTRSSPGRCRPADNSLVWLERTHLFSSTLRVVKPVSIITMNAIWARRYCGMMLRSPCAKYHRQRGLYALKRFSSTQTDPTPITNSLSDDERSSALPLSEYVETPKNTPQHETLHPKLDSRYKAGDHVPAGDTLTKKAIHLYIRPKNMIRNEQFIKL
jgi:hypothetical protein